jgi:transposase InsO family protein
VLRRSLEPKQYTSIAYTERLGEISAVRSVGRKGDSYDHAAAESLNSLYKKELIEREWPWRGVDDVMLATLEWVAWHNTERLHSACGYVPPKEFEESYYALQESVASLSHPANEGLQRSRGAPQHSAAGKTCP